MLTRDGAQRVVGDYTIHYTFCLLLIDRYMQSNFVWRKAGNNYPNASGLSGKYFKSGPSIAKIRVGGVLRWYTGEKSPFFNEIL